MSLFSPIALTTFSLPWHRHLRAAIMPSFNASYCNSFFRLKHRTIIYFRTQASLVCVGNDVEREQNRGKFYVCKIVHSSIADTPRRWKWHQTSRFPRCRVLWLRRWKGKTLVTAFVHIVRAAWRAPPRYHFIFRCQNILLVKFYSRCSLIKCSLYNKESSSSLSLSRPFSISNSIAYEARCGEHGPWQVFNAVSCALTNTQITYNECCDNRIIREPPHNHVPKPNTQPTEQWTEHIKHSEFCVWYLCNYIGIGVTRTSAQRGHSVERWCLRPCRVRNNTLYTTRSTYLPEDNA